MSKKWYFCGKPDPRHLVHNYYFCDFPGCTKYMRSNNLAYHKETHRAKGEKGTDELLIDPSPNLHTDYWRNRYAEKKNGAPKTATLVVTALVKDEDNSPEEPPAPKVKSLRRCTKELAPNNPKRNAIRKAKKLEIASCQITSPIGPDPVHSSTNNIEQGRYDEIEKALKIGREK